MLYMPSMSLDERATLPLNGPGNYRVKDNCIYTRAIEINATKHCNLSCRSCSHSSPITPPCFSDLDTLKRDLETLKKYLRCEIVRIVGGEPLLHPRFNELVETIKSTGISEKVSLITNGTLLPGKTIKELGPIDEMEISMYPSNSKKREQILRAAEKLSPLLKKLRVLDYSSFRESISQNPTQDMKLVQQIYETCQIAHFYRCLTIDNDYLYRCPQSMVSQAGKDNKEAIKISSIQSVDEVLSFIEQNEAPHFCATCLGSVGKQFNHELLRRDEWISQLPTTPEEGLDYDYIKVLRKNAHEVSSCLQRFKV